MSERADNRRYQVEYQTNYNEQYWHKEVMFAPNEGSAIEKFNRFCRKHEVRLTNMRVTQVS